MKMVYIVVHDGGCEGYSEPLKVFEVKALADLYVEAANRHSGGFKVFEMEAITFDTLSVPYFGTGLAQGTQSE